MEEFVYFSAPRTEFVSLGRSSSGRTFKKQILKFGSYDHPSAKGEKLLINAAQATALIKNFNDKVCDIVQVPIVDGANRHVEDPLRNLGEVIGLEQDADGVNAIIDARKYADDLGKTLIGASAMMHLNYTDVRTGKKVGPTLLHVAITNRPYITDLSDFEELVAASADTFKDETPVVLTASEEEVKMDKAEAFEYLRSEHGIDVDALIQSSEDVATALSAAGTAATEGEDLTTTEVAEAVVELSQEKAALETRVDALESELSTSKQSKAEREVDDLIKAGRVLPKQRDVLVALSQSDRETFEKLVPDEPVIALSEDGVTVFDEPGSASLEKAQEEIDRLALSANELRGGSK